MPIIQISVLILKKYGYWQLSQTLQWVVYLSTYLMATIFNFYVYKITNHKYYLNHEDPSIKEPVVRTPIYYWLKVELYIFMINVCNIMIFLLLAFIFKYQPLKK